MVAPADDARPIGGMPDRPACALATSTPVPAPEGAARPVIHLIEDDPALREAGRCLFEGAGWMVCDHFSAEAFLACPRPAGAACLVVDMMLPGMNGLALLEALRTEGVRIPAVMLTGRSDAATAVAAMKAGAVDFIEKPAEQGALVASVAEALERGRVLRAVEMGRARSRARFDTLTPRERDVMGMVLDGTPNKIIAATLGISQRTVENHRANVMHKTGAASLPALVRLHMEAHGPE